MARIVKYFELNNRLYPGTPRSGLNIRQLLNPIFFSPVIRHQDMKRQLSRRQRAKDFAVARRLKSQYVPLCHVDKTVYLCEYNSQLDREVVYPYELRVALSGGL